MRTHTTADGRVFTLVREQPHRRRDGTHTTLLVWQTPCAHPGCTGVRTVTTPAVLDPSQTKAFLSKHCPDHAISRDEFMRRGREALRARQAELSARGAAAKRRLSDQDVADMRAAARAGVPIGALALTYPASPGTIREILAGRRR